MRYYMTKDNLLWANYQGWSHYFRNLYNHIVVYHPEVGYSAGKTRVYEYPSKYGYIFDPNSLATGDNIHYCYSIIASAYWLVSDCKNNFMGDIDLDSHNGGDSGGMHGTYVGTLLRLANSVPSDKSGLSFQVDFHVFEGIGRLSFQTIHLDTIAYW